jgi:hypothetical protein
VPPIRTVSKNRTLFREVNERIRDVNARFGASEGMYLALCECERAGCTAHVEVSAAVHAEICADPGRFIVAPGHEVATETVLAEASTYSIVAPLPSPESVPERDGSSNGWTAVPAPALPAPADG